MGKIKCSACDKLMDKRNMPRHLDRAHKSHTGESSEMSTCMSSCSSTRDPSPCCNISGRRVPQSQIDLDLLEVQIQKAVACMLRREVRNDMDTLRNYLARRFPLIKPELRDAVILTTFKTAQRVAAAHSDAIQKEPDARSEWAKKALSRWLSGLSVVEPPADYAVTDSRTVVVNQDTQLPVLDVPPKGDIHTPSPLKSYPGVAPSDVKHSSDPILSKSQQELVSTEFEEATTMILAASSKYEDPNVVPAVVDSRLEEVADKLESARPSSPDPTVEPDDPVGPILHIPDPECSRSVASGQQEAIIAELPAELSFHDLLDVTGSGCNLYKELYEPLIDLSTPEISPGKSAQEVPASKPKDPKSQLPILTMSEPVSTPVSVPAARKEVIKEGPSAPKKPRSEHGAKENRDPKKELLLNELPKRKDPAPKMKSKVQAPPISWSEKDHPKEAHTVGISRRMYVEHDVEDCKLPVPNFKMPLKPRDDRRRHFQVTRDRSPSNDYRHGLYGGFGRGYHPDGVRGRGRGNPRALPFSRPRRIPGLSVEEQECIDRMRRSRDARF